MVHARTAILVGASAGGVLALTRLAAQIPAGLPAAILMTQHITAEEGPSLARIISRKAPMPAAFGRNGERVEAGRIYIAPPGAHMTVVAPGRIHLAVVVPEWRAQPADALLRSGADVYGSRAIGVVLAGHAGDTTGGLLAIKRAGGISIAQHPGTVDVPDSPAFPLLGDPPDYCVRLWQLPRLLRDLLVDLERGEVRVVAPSAPAAAANCTIYPWPKGRRRTDD